jgi:hypothetical protein
MKTNFALCAVFVATHLPNFVLLPIFAYAYFFDMGPVVHAGDGLRHTL